MRPHEIEAWVLSIVDRVNRGGRVEDVRLELKAEWPDVTKAARRIAGHCNASGGESVLWIIGINEQGGVVRYPEVDLAEWCARLRAEFDGVPPDFTHIAVPSAEGSLHALLFDTSRRPFVVRNPVYGQSGGGSVALEVPWREGTAVRSARRDELVRMLAPIDRLPALDVISGHVTASIFNLQPTGDEKLNWFVSLTLYIVPGDGNLLVLPRHRASITLSIGSHEIRLERPLLSPRRMTSIGRDGLSTRNTSETISSTEDELIASGPGKAIVSAKGVSDYAETSLSGSYAEDAEVVVTLRAARGDAPAVAFARIPYVGSVGRDKPQWVLEES